MKPFARSRRLIGAIIGATVAAATSFVAAPAQADASTLTSVSGTVTVDGTPTAGLKVCAGAALFVTDTYQDFFGCTLTAADGSYTATFDFPGSSEMAFSWVDPGTEYQDVFPPTSAGENRSGLGYFHLEQGNHLVGVDIAVKAFPIVHGRVVDSVGAPIAGASVEAGVKTVSTDATGAFTVPARVAYDGGQLWVKAEGFVDGALHLNASGIPDGSSTIVLTRIGSVGTPMITGSLRVGKKLTAVIDLSGVDGATVSYSWFRNGAKIRGANKATYRLVKKDRRKRMSVAVTVRVPGKDPITVTSAPTAKVGR